MGSVRISCASGFRALGIQCIGQSHSEMMVASAGSRFGVGVQGIGSRV